MKKTLSVLWISLFSILSSFACSCIETNESLSIKVERAFTNSDLIFTGKVVDIEVVNKEELTSSADPVIYKFEIEKIIRGEIRKEIIEIASAASGASCGYDFKLGESYLVYARKSNHFASKTNNDFDFVTGLCDRNQRLKDVHKKEFRKLKRLNCRNSK